MRETKKFSISKEELCEALMLYVNSSGEIRIKSPKSITNICVIKGPPQDGDVIECIDFTVEEKV